MKGKSHIIANFLGTDLVICSHSREGETPSYSQINPVMANSLSSHCLVRPMMAIPMLRLFRVNCLI